MRTSHVRTAVVAGLREYVRTPVLLAILVVAPAYLVGLFGYAAPDTPVPVEIPSGGQTLAPLSNVLTLLGVVMVGAMVGGIVGLFVVQSATDADARVAIAGFAPGSILLARGILIAVAASATVAVSLAVALLVFSPASILGVALAGLLTALVYGLIGVVVGTQVDRLAGVWILLFVPLLDIVLFQNPLATETKTLATVLPAHATMQLSVGAGFGGGIEVAQLVTALGYLSGVAVLATLLYYRRT
jgi:ABC-2 type transport system permease protein